MRRLAFSRRVAGHHRIYAEGGYDLQEYAYRYLYGADRERSNVGDQKIAVSEGACRAGGSKVACCCDQA
jgi:hypothetical protein